jgi:hypothetical protein
MKNFLISVTIIVVTILLALITSILLDFKFIQAFAIRMFCIYIVIMIILFIGFRLLYLINYKK